MILCPLFVAVGYDTVIAVLVTYVATQIGGSSWMKGHRTGKDAAAMVMWVVFNKVYVKTSVYFK